MAKIGLNYGEKLQIVNKTYRVITDGLNVPEILGKLTSVVSKDSILFLKKITHNEIPIDHLFRSTLKRSAVGG